MSLTALAAWAALLWAALILGMALAAIVLRRRQIAEMAAMPVTPTTHLKVLLVRPCAGLDPQLEAALRSLSALRFQGTLDLVMAVSDDADPALTVLNKLAPELRQPGRNVTVEVHSPRGPNRKASLFAAVCDKRLDHYDVLISADSNVDLSQLDLDKVLAPMLEKPKLGALWLPSFERVTSPQVGARASAAVLGSSLHAFPLLAGIDPAGLVGKFFILRATSIKDIGGLDQFVDFLGEDAALSRQLRSAAWQVVPSAQLVPAYASGADVTTAVARFARWMTVIRAQRPWLLLSYPIFFFPSFGLAAFALMGLAAQPFVSGASLILAVVGRLVVATGARHFAGLSSHVGPALTNELWAEWILLRSFGRALRSRQVLWRGQALRITADGRLQTVESLSVAAVK